jgi:hypothetical protein
MNFLGHFELDSNFQAGAVFGSKNVKKNERNLHNFLLEKKKTNLFGRMIKVLAPHDL